MGLSGAYARPQVEFYFAQDSAITARDNWIAFDSKYKPRLFEIDYCWHRRDACPNMDVDPEDIYLSPAILSQSDHRRVTVKELFTIPSTQYEIKESTIAIDENLGRDAKIKAAFKRIEERL
jgi:hypothetical protein